MRKLTVVAVLAVTMAFASVAASAQILYEEHFDSLPLGYNGVSEARGKSDFGEAIWFPYNGFLESGNSDAIYELLHEFRMKSPRIPGDGTAVVETGLIER